MSTALERPAVAKFAALVMAEQGAGGTFQACLLPTSQGMGNPIRTVIHSNGNTVEGLESVTSCSL